MTSFESKKLYYTIGEASKITGLPSYLLRYWENDFEQLAPGRNPKGNRVYTNKDISTILTIKELIQEQGYTIERAKALMLERSGVQIEKPETAELLKAHQQEVKDQTWRDSNDDRRKQALLEAKDVLEDLLAFFK